MAKGDITKEEVESTISVDNSSEFKHIHVKLLPRPGIAI